MDVRRFPASRANPAAAHGEVADLAAEIGIAVGHLMHDGPVKEHIPSEAARPGPGGYLEWPA